MHLTLQQVQFRPNVASSSKHLTKNIKHFDYHYCSLSRLNLNIMQLFNCYLLLLSLDFHKVLWTMYKTMKNSELNHILKKNLLIKTKYTANWWSGDEGDNIWKWLCYIVIPLLKCEKVTLLKKVLPAQTVYREQKLYNTFMYGSPPSPYTLDAPNTLSSDKWHQEF